MDACFFQVEVYVQCRPGNQSSFSFWRPEILMMIFITIMTFKMLFDFQNIVIYVPLFFNVFNYLVTNNNYLVTNNFHTLHL